jgi:hypothetical protein
VAAAQGLLVLFEHRLVHRPEPSASWCELTPSRWSWPGGGDCVPRTDVRINSLGQVHRTSNPATGQAPVIISVRRLHSPWMSWIRRRLNRRPQ